MAPFLCAQGRARMCRVFMKKIVLPFASLDNGVEGEGTGSWRDFEIIAGRVNVGLIREWWSVSTSSTLRFLLRFEKFRSARNWTRRILREKKISKSITARCYTNKYTTMTRLEILS